MKKTLAFIWVFILPMMAGAQIHYQDCKNPEILRHAEKVDPFRQEFILPQVNGYNV